MGNRAFLGLNVATLMVYAGLSIMFFPLPFDLVDRRALPSTEAGLVFLPFTLGVGLLSRVFGDLADKVAARAMLIAGPAGAALPSSEDHQSETPVPKPQPVRRLPLQKQN